MGKYPNNKDQISLRAKAEFANMKYTESELRAKKLNRVSSTQFAILSN